MRAGFTGADLTMLATAVSEVARNIVRFAGSGEVVIELLSTAAGHARRRARRRPRASPTSTRALTDGYSTYDGLGLGLPGSRRLMDEFEIDVRGGARHHRHDDQMVRQEGTVMSENDTDRDHPTRS